MEKIKLLPRYLSILIIGLLFLSCNKKQSPSAPVVTPPVQPPVEVVRDSIPNGVNLQPSYYNGGNPNFGWELMKQQTKIKTLRIEIEPDKVSEAKVWISQAKANGYMVIATYHKFKALGSDDAAELLAAANWWKENYTLLGGNFIINLMNEWGSHDITASAYATAYNNALAIVRTVYKGPVILDIPGWGQETFTAYQAIKKSNPVITDTNIILSAHIYTNGWNKGKNRNLQPSDLDDLSSTGRRGMIGEFGNGGNGSVDWAACVDYAKSKGWPVLGWCWNGDGGNMNMVDPSWAINSTATTFTLGSYFSVIYRKL